MAYLVGTSVTQQRFGGGMALGGLLALVGGLLGCTACIRAATTNPLYLIPLPLEPHALAGLGDDEALIGGCSREGSDRLGSGLASIFRVNKSQADEVYRGVGVVVGIQSDPTGKEVFADILEIPGPGSRAHRLLRSSDGGRSFREQGRIASGDLGKVALTRGHLLVLGEGGALLQSADGGKQWEKMIVPGRRSLGTDYVLETEAGLYVLGADSVFTTDRASWRTVDTEGVPVVGGSDAYVIGRQGTKLKLGLVTGGSVIWQGDLLGNPCRGCLPVAMKSGGARVEVLVNSEPGDDVMWLVSEDRGMSWTKQRVPGAASSGLVAFDPVFDGGVLVDLHRTVTRFW
jgi:hypothetical protein